MISLYGYFLIIGDDGWVCLILGIEPFEFELDYLLPPFLGTQLHPQTVQVLKKIRCTCKVLLENFMSI